MGKTSGCQLIVVTFTKTLVDYITSQVQLIQD